MANLNLMLIRSLLTGFRKKAAMQAVAWLSKRAVTFGCCRNADITFDPHFNSYKGNNTQEPASRPAPCGLLQQGDRLILCENDGHLVIAEHWRSVTSFPTTGKCRDTFWRFPAPPSESTTIWKLELKRLNNASTCWKLRRKRCKRTSGAHKSPDSRFPFSFPSLQTPAVYSA